MAARETILNTYAEPVDPAVPLVCVDEAGKELQADARPPVPPAPSQPTRPAYEYRRQGSANLFLPCAPHLGWRHVTVTRQRTAVDWALAMRELVDVPFPEADRIVLVLDMLTTHRLSSLDTAFPTPGAHRLARKLEVRFTPQHGSWRTRAERELSVLNGQGPDRRIPDRETLATEVAAWVVARNAVAAPAHWTLSVDNARTRLAHLYPIPVCDTLTWTVHSG